MKHNRIMIALLLVALVVPGLTLAASVLYAVHLPIVMSAPVATTCASTGTELLDQDTGLLTAGQTSDGRYVLAYQDRAHGSQAHVVQHVGDHLVELAAPPSGVVFSGPTPQFSPDGVKQGALALVMGTLGQKDRLYYTQRRPDDTPNEGPYGIWCMEF